MQGSYVFSIPGATGFAGGSGSGSATTGPCPVVIRTTGVQTTGVQTSDVQTTAVQTTSVQTTGVQTTSVGTTEVQTSGAQPTGLQAPTCVDGVGPGPQPSSGAFVPFQC